MGDYRFNAGDPVEAMVGGCWLPATVFEADGDSTFPYHVISSTFSGWLFGRNVRARAATHDGKADAGKPPWPLLPWDALAHVVAVLGYGAKTYGPNTWQSVPDGQERYLGAMLRHIAAWKSGEVNDLDSGLPHLAHVATNALFVLALGVRK